LTDARLRELHERMLDARGEATRERCATPEALLAVVRHEGPEDERLATLDHVMSCGDCVRELELLRALERAGAEGGREHAGDAVEFRPRLSWRRFTPLALAASVILAVAIGLMRRDGGPSADDISRSGDEAVTLLAPAAELAAGDPVLFVWRPVAGATRYELELVDDAGNVAFSTTTADTTATLPAARRLVPGAEYRWAVRVVDPLGSQRASAMRALRVRRE
jgi:hypothetical protein